MEKILLIAFVITIMSSFFITPIIIGHMIKASFFGKFAISIAYLSVLVVFLAMFGLKKNFEVGSWFTNAYVFVAVLFMLQAFFGVLIYVTFILKGLSVPVPHPISISLLIAIILTAVSWHNGQKLTISKIDVKMPNLKKELVIAHLPDIHLGHFQTNKYLKKVIEITNKHNPDIVILNGDLFEDNYRLQKNVKETLSKFKGKVIFTEGNHETYVCYPEIKNLIRELGFIHLENTQIEIEGVQFVGTDYLDSDKDSVGVHKSPNDIYLNDFLSTISLDEKKPSILIQHAPYGAKYANKTGFNLMISGHTHGGGQMWPITLFSKAFFEYSSGRYKLGNMDIYISEGVGTFGVPLRLGTKNEINIIYLKHLEK